MKIGSFFILALLAACDAAIVSRPRIFDLLDQIAQAQSDPFSNELVPARLSEVPMIADQLEPADNFMASLLSQIAGQVAGDSMHDRMASLVQEQLSKTHIAENSTQIVVSIELIGWSQSEIQVSLHGSALTVTGEHKCDKDSLVYCEQKKFSEVFGLNTEVASLKDASAEMHDGLLVISIPKRKKEEIDEKRVLQISAGGSTVEQKEPGKLTIQMV